MDERLIVFATAGVIVIYFLAQVLTRRFDPFAPIWLFLVGYAQVYVIQAVSYHDWAVSVRGKDLVEAASLRSLWALVWFLTVYHLGIGGRIAPVLPQPPRNWSPLAVALLSPPLVVWGLYCSNVLIRWGDGVGETVSAEESLFRSFPFMMLVAGILLIVTGRTITAPRPVFLPAGLVVAAAYVLIWMFNGKRSHSLIGVLATVSALFITRLRRPSWAVLLLTSFVGTLVVTIAIGWRNNSAYERSVAGFANFLGDFQISRILESLNVSDGEEEVQTYETTEYGGFLLMMDTVPEKSGYDYGANYIRVVSTFIPRIIWPSKPLYGRSQWVGAWIAGSEMDRDEDFTGPAIGILGATQLNGGAIGTLIVLGVLAILLRTAYDYLRLYQDVAWVQFWWSITFYNAWFMVVTDDPLVWFYYNWGFSAGPVVVLMWWVCKLGVPQAQQALAAQTAI
jgi:hypothetical protein